MSSFTPVNIFDFQPKISEISGNEPSLRKLILGYYTVGLSSLEPRVALEKARRYTDEYIAQILEAYFGISRSD
jgi:hypothetical protein